MGWKALGIALMAQDQDAVDALQRATALMPGDAELAGSLVEAHLRRGHACMKAGRAQDATTGYAAAVRLAPTHAHAQACLGIALQATGRLDEAVPHLERAVAARPDLVDARFALAGSLLTLGRAEAARDHLLDVIARAPAHAHAHADLGNAWRALGRLDAALPAYRRAIELEPDAPQNHANLGAACRELGRMDEALACYGRVLDLEPSRLSAASDRLFIRNYLPGDATPSRTSEARRFGELVAARARPRTRWKDHGHERLRVGFVSADLREHPVGYFVEGLLAELAGAHADRIAAFVYANTERVDALTERLKAHVHRWTSIARLGDEAAADLIHDDAIDILIDLSGHTAGNRLPLFAWKPAPVQVTWLGDCATTGVDAIDGFLADPWIAPQGSDGEFTERVRRLPETFLCFTPPKRDLPVAPLPAAVRGHVTFGCFNKVNKLGDAVVASWARVLAAVPDSRLFLKSGPLGADAIRRDLLRRFGEHGIAEERLTLEGPSPRDDYLRAYERVDIALDPFPYPGGTTSVEGLWMGVPVLTRAGSSALARQGTSLMRNVGLPEWIAIDDDDHLARAVRHAGDVEALAALRGGLRDRLLASPVCDHRRFAGHFVQALEAMRARQ